MLNIPAIKQSNAAGKERRAERTWTVWYTGLMATAAFLAFIMYRSGPEPALIGWLIYLVGAVAILYQPRYGIYLLLFWGLAGDNVLAPWYPFLKNFSSRETIFYLNDAIIVSPLEVYLVLTFVSWLGRGTMRRRINFYASSLLWPALIFLSFVLFGLIYGLGVRGGNVNIGLWEARSIFYLPAMLILTSNLLQRRQHVSHFMWAVMLALFVEGLSGAAYYFFVLGTDLRTVDAITEHAAAIHMNTFFLFTLAVWMYRATPQKRIILPLMVPVVMITYVATQRRAAFLSLGIALIFVAIILYKENRRAFWFVVPAVTVVGLLYISLFWNAGGALSLPAQAVKSVVAPEQASAADRSSNYYRYLENINSSFTIHTAPLTGVGFGNKFRQLVRLPNISWFIWYEYVTHNSIIWIWIKTGVGGFLSLLVLIGLSVMVSVQTLWRMPGDELSAAALTATLYIIMHFTYAYADISWDSQSMLYVGAMMGMIGSLKLIANRPDTGQEKHRAWQRAPKPAFASSPIAGSG